MVLLDGHNYVTSYYLVALWSLVIRSLSCTVSEIWRLLQCTWQSVTLRSHLASMRQFKLLPTGAFPVICWWWPKPGVVLKAFLPLLPVPYVLFIGAFSGCLSFDCDCKGKSKGFPYSIPSVGPGADRVQAVSLQVTVSHLPGSRLPLFSARPAVTSPPAEHHRPLAGTKLYWLVKEAHRCEQLAQGCYAASPRVGSKPVTYWSQVQRSTRWLRL